MARELNDMQKDWNVRVNASYKKDALKRHNERMLARQERLKAPVNS